MTTIFLIGLALAIVCLFLMLFSPSTAGKEFSWVLGVALGAFLIAFSRGLIRL